ncbi:PREDICTED: E3 ubiquitin-protein ligase SINA-like 2 [Camelina sativa]|uniref:E3 ubiquitin-protein ligase SINA-like 2 n=1 Tax=Camelina sativa TaxID=90675 RepID=A0ABM1R3G5_CAMSA|nr:PREDICTED: E3 ubiquitin-protein ligase SINA-like 2 [Camelina sativa]
MDGGEVEAVIVPCPYVNFGCTEKFTYGEELVHERKCRFAVCRCPAPYCRYSGVYKDLYSHFSANHNDEDYYAKFVCGSFTGARLSINEKILFLQESADGPLVAVQCFAVEEGFYVTVNCIAPSSPGVGEFSYHLSYTTPVGGRKRTMTFKQSEMNRIQRFSSETPEKDFMFVPYDFVGDTDSMKMEICINRR